MAERLALCLVMLAVLPEGARRKRGVALKAIAREAERAAKHPADHGQTQLVPGCSSPEASSFSNMAPQLDQPAEDTKPSGPLQEKMQGSSHELPLPPLSAVARTVWTKWKHCASPSQSSKSVDFGPGTPTPSLLLKPCAFVGAQQEDKSGSHGQQRPPCHTEMCNPGRSEGSLPPWGVSAEGKPGDEAGAKHVHSASSGAAPSSSGVSETTEPLSSPQNKSMLGFTGGASWIGSGNVQAGALHQWRQGEGQKKRKSGQVALDGVRHKAARLSRGHMVCDPSEMCLRMRLLAEMTDDESSSSGVASMSWGDAEVPEPAPGTEEERISVPAPHPKGILEKECGGVDADAAQEGWQTLQEKGKAGPCGSHEPPTPLSSARGVTSCSNGKLSSSTGLKGTELQRSLTIPHIEPHLLSSPSSHNRTSVEVGPDTTAPPALMKLWASRRAQKEPNQGNNAQQSAPRPAESSSPGKSGGPLPCDMSPEGIPSTDGLARQAAQPVVAQKVCRLSVSGLACASLDCALR
jgi:hypothetical protein